MKKAISILSLVCFIAVNIASAQTVQTTSADKDSKKTEAVKSEEKSGMGCCKKVTKACCKSNSAAKNCTPEQKAACAKAGAKAEEAKAEDSQKDTKEGTN